MPEETMSKSKRKFDRWTPHEASTWSFQVYSKYDDELGKLNTAHLNARKFAYTKLGSQLSEWSDTPEDALNTGDKFLTAFATLKDWSNSYNDFENWMNLNSVLAHSSNLETYLAGVIDTAIRSNPGILMGYPRGIDGAILLKRKARKLATSKHVEECTKGQWSRRFSAIRGVFGTVPSEATQVERELEKIRAIRNRVGHAFGRDIARARDHGVRNILPMERISTKQALKLRDACRTFARAMDKYLLNEHIGDFEALRFYAINHKQYRTDARVADLKRAIGTIGANSRGKAYCQGVIEYWESL